MSNSRISHLIARQTNSNWLRRVAFEKFARAHDSGRLIAYVGSFASRHLDYPSWEKMWDSFQEKLVEIGRTKPDWSASKSDFLAYIFDAEGKDDTTLADLAELYAGIDRDANKDAFENLRRDYLAKNFEFQVKSERTRLSRPQIAEALFESLDLRRVVTLNYDMELEWPVMTMTGERRRNRNEVWESLRASSTIAEVEGRLVRDLPGGIRAASECLFPNFSSRVAEFGLGFPDLDQHIMHLHGRVDQPLSALITRRDYREQYWRTTQHSLPLKEAHKVLFAGNPILFVGTQASEPDVMRTLEQFLSNNPNRRRTSIFLLWNADSDSDSNEFRRMWFYRQYGVHLLYDNEIEQFSDRSAVPYVPPKYEAQLKMAHSLEGLSDVTSALGLANERKLIDFRDPQTKFDGKAGNRLISLWQSDFGHHDRPEFDDPAPLVKRVDQEGGVFFVQGGPGNCRGACSSALMQAFTDRLEPANDHRRVIEVNASFCFETDSISAILSGAFDGKTAFSKRTGRFFEVANLAGYINEAIKSEIERINAGKPGDPARHVTIIITGTERLISHDGKCLSTEVDFLIRHFLDLTEGRSAAAQEFHKLLQDYRATAEVLGQEIPYPVSLIMLGTDRVRRYLENISDTKRFEVWSVRRQGRELILETPRLNAAKARNVAGLTSDEITSHSVPNTPCYFERVAEELDPDSVPLAREGKAKRRPFLERVLAPQNLSAMAGCDPVTALEILKSIAFIGQPVEASALAHVPRLMKRAKEKRQNCIAMIKRELAKLRKVHLVIQLKPFISPGEPRFGLHKAVLTELRERFGVPLSESRLASGFNLSLYAAQPSDSYLPDQSWHDDLGTMVDWLLGSYRDDCSVKECEAFAKTLDDRAFWEPLYRRAPFLQFYSPIALARLGTRENAYTLRAALSLLRGYFSTPALIMRNNRQLDEEARDGPLTEHSERLARLLRVHRDAVAVRDYLFAKTSGLPKNFRRIAGPQALYADDLLWVQNELGVNYLAQGQLYDARAAFAASMESNDRFVSFGKKGPNWLRLAINRVQLEYERGYILEAQELLRDIRQTIDDLGRVMADGANEYLRRDNPYSRIIATYGREDSSSAPEQDHEFPTELILLSAIACAYEGLCLHLRGQLEDAEAHYKPSITILRKLGEERSYALFLRHYAALLASRNKMGDAISALDECVASAGPGRHPDIDHSGRCGLVLYSSKLDSPKPQVTPLQRRVPQLMESYRYAQASDMYRLQVEVAQLLAVTHLENGDTDSALRFATEAMSIAASGGFALRKVSLRILLGRIHLARGQRELANDLLSSAARLSIRMRYERATEAAENLLIACKN